MSQILFVCILCIFIIRFKYFKTCDHCVYNKCDTTANILKSLSYPTLYPEKNSCFFYIFAVMCDNDHEEEKRNERWFAVGKTRGMEFGGKILDSQDEFLQAFPGA